MKTTIIYVLIEVLMKYLRLKCESFIRDKITPPLPSR